MMIGQALQERGITAPADIGAALGMSPAEAVRLLNRKRVDADELALLKAAAAKLGTMD
jgi:hypothetical protein